MAFEVARVHQLICSRVGDGVDFKALKSESASVEANPTFSPTCSPRGDELHPHYAAELSYNFPGYDRGCDTSSLPLELSSVSTGTESDEDDDLLQSLAQQIAHSMLDDDSNAETFAGVGGGSGYSEARNISSVEVNEASFRDSSSFSIVLK